MTKSLLREQPQYKEIGIPRDEDGQRQILRSLLNVRRPGNISGAFLAVQDEYLLEETAKIAVQAVKEFRSQAVSDMEVVFNVFKGADYEICRDLLS